MHILRIKRAARSGHYDAPIARRFHRGPGRLGKPERRLSRDSRGSYEHEEYDGDEPTASPAASKLRGRQRNFLIQRITDCIDPDFGIFLRAGFARNIDTEFIRDGTG